MFLIEMGLGVVLPIAILMFRKVRTSERGLVVASFFVVLGFVMYRLNVSITGMEAAAGVRYLPSWMEIVVSFGLVSIGMAVFAVAVRYLPIFHQEPAAREPGRSGHRLGSDMGRGVGPVEV